MDQQQKVHIIQLLITSILHYSYAYTSWRFDNCTKGEFYIAKNHDNLQFQNYNFSLFDTLETRHLTMTLEFIGTKKLIF